MTPKLICISGKVASGKTTLSQRIAEIIECNRFSISDYLKSIAKQRYDIIDRPLLQKLGEECINKGWDKFANDFLSFIYYKKQNNYTIIDGIRHVEFYKSLYHISSKQSVLIYIEVNDEELLKRLMLRGEKDINYSHIAEGNLSKIKDISDYILNADDKDIEILSYELLQKLNLKGSNTDSNE